MADETNPEEIAPERTVALGKAMLEEVRGELERADQKASLLIGSLGIAFSVVLGGMLGGDWAIDDLGPWSTTLWIAGGAAAIASVLSAALAVWPRLTKAPPGGTITFWGHLHDVESPAHLARALEERGLHDPERIFQQLLVLSALVQRKYRWIRWSMIAAGAAGLLAGLAFVVQA